MDETPIEPVTPVLTIDYRYRWLSETISKLLGISDRKFAENLLCDHSEKIRCYFDDAINDFADCNKRLLFIWRTFYDKLVEETISVLEEGKNANIFISYISIKKKKNRFSCTSYSSARRDKEEDQRQR